MVAIKVRGPRKKDSVRRSKFGGVLVGSATVQGQTKPKTQSSGTSCAA